MSGTGADWGRISSGIFWIGIGTFLLLNTTGTLPWSIWLDALAYWPVLLVLAGVRLLVNRSRYPWLALLSPLVMLGTLTLVALGAPRGPSGDRIGIHAERGAATERWLLGGTVVFSAVDLQAGSLPEDRLLAGTVVSRGDPSVRTTQSGAETRVRLRGAKRGPVVLVPGPDERWELTLADDLPLELDLELAFDRGEFDLSQIDVTGIDLQGAFNDLRLHLGTPSSNVRVNVEGAFNALTLVVPEDVPVYPNTDGFLNLVDRRRDRPPTGGPGYRLRVQGAFSRTVVRSD